MSNKSVVDQLQAIIENSGDVASAEMFIADDESAANIVITRPAGTWAFLVCEVNKAGEMVVKSVKENKSNVPITRQKPASKDGAQAIE